MNMTCSVRVVEELTMPIRCLVCFVRQALLHTQQYETGLSILCRSDGVGMVGVMDDHNGLILGAVDLSIDLS